MSLQLYGVMDNTPTPLASHMEAEDNTDDTDTLKASLNQSAIIATSLVAQHTQYIQHKWNPSDGYNANHLQWKRQLNTLARANGILPGALDELPPPQPKVHAGYTLLALPHQISSCSKPYARATTGRHGTPISTLTYVTASSSKGRMQQPTSGRLTPINLAWLLTLEASFDGYPVYEYFPGTKFGGTQVAGNPKFAHPEARCRKRAVERRARLTVILVHTRSLCPLSARERVAGNGRSSAELM